MGLLDRFEQTLERLLEGTTGALFRQKIQPAEIGKKLERAMLDNQRPSVGSSIVPNAYTVRLNPKDFAQVEAWAGGLARQMELWLFQVASRRQLTVLDKMTVEFVEDKRVPQRNPRIEAIITDRAPSPQKRPARRPAPPRYEDAGATSVFNVPSRSSSEIRLRATSGPVSGSVWSIPEGTSTIGRSSDNTIVIDLPDVSRRHARIERSGSHLRIYDMNSTNGTRINGEAIHISDIQEGDQVQVGSQVLEVYGDDAWAGEGYHR